MTELSRRTVLGGFAGAAALTGLPATTAVAGDGDGGGPVRAVGLTTGHLTDPLGTGLGAPRFGWRLRADGNDRAQSAYRIVVGTAPGRADVWDSGQVGSPEQTGRRYDGPPLRARTRYHWALQVWDEHGRPGPLSRPAWFETALADGDWQAGWIGSGLLVAKPTRVLPAGQVEPVTLTPGHTLGQSFESDSPLAAVVVLLEVPAGETAATTMTLHRDRPDGPVVADRRLTGLTGDAYGSAQGRLDLAEPAAPGRYYLELSDSQGAPGWSGTTYRQPNPDGTYADDVYDQGTAFADRASVPSEDRWLCVVPPAPPANPLVRKEFRLPGPVRSARLYLSGLGHGEAWINGRRVGDDVLTPVATDYDKRVLYTSHDVTALLRAGGNAVGVALGRGFFGTRAPDSDGTNLAAWIAEPQLKAQLEVTLAGGRRIVLATGPDWQLTDGPTTYDGLHAGESYDARRAAELDGWSTAGFDAHKWKPVAVVKDPGGRLEPYPGEHLRADPPIEPVRETDPAAGVRVYDFGEVLSGWARLSGRLAAGTVVRMVYGEKLDTHGRVLVGTPGGAENPGIDGRWQIDEYTATAGRQSWQPAFTYKGFQYVEVSGAEVDLVAVPVGSDVADTMELRLEHPELQWIADAFRRTGWNGLHGYPDLSPQTMVGWLGAARNAAEPMLYQFGMARLFEHWLDDIRVAQAPSGAIPIVAPFGGPANDFMFSPVYVSLYPHLVRRHWIAYGDRSVPERHYDAVRRCLDWVLSQLKNDLVVEEAFGDWYPPGIELGEHPRGAEGGRLVGSAFVIQAVRDGIALAELLAKPEQAAWRARVTRMTARFNAEFLDTTAGIYRTEVTTAGYRQASNAIPLALGLVPAQHVGTVVAHLAADVEAKDRHLDTGSMGTGALPYALSDHGRADLAVAVLGQTSYPGYGALRRMGATTLWESWEPHARGHNDTTIGNPVRWLVERAAGVEPLAPGWARFRVRPRVTDSLPGASIALDTVRGRIGVRWRRTGGELVITVEVPVNAGCELVLPDGRSHQLGSGRHRVALSV